MGTEVPLLGNQPASGLCSRRSLKHTDVLRDTLSDRDSSWEEGLGGGLFAESTESEVLSPVELQSA